MNTSFLTPLRQPKKLLALSFLSLGLLTTACEQKVNQFVIPQPTTANSANLRLGAAEPQSTTGLTTKDLIHADPSQLKPIPSSKYGVMTLFTYEGNWFTFPMQVYLDGKYVGTLKRGWKGGGELWSPSAPISDKTLWLALTPGQHTLTFHMPDGKLYNYRGQYSYGKPFEYTGGLWLWWNMLEPVE